MRKVILDRTFSTNTEYKTSERTVYVFRYIGTNLAENVTVKIDGKECGIIHSDIAPKHRNADNLYGPLYLRELFYVVPPETKFEFTSSSSGEVRVIGDLILLDIGETAPGDLLTRFNEQHRHFYTVFSGSYTFGTDEAFADGQEVTLFDKRNESNESFKLNHIAGVSVSNVSGYAQGQIGVRIYLNEVPYDTLDSSEGKFGIDSYNMPLPPTASVESRPFSFKVMPLEVPADNRLRITAINVSGGNLTPPSGSAISITFRAVAEYLRRV